MTGNKIGAKIRGRREMMGLNQQELADGAKISRTYLSLIERGEANNITYNVLRRLALALRTTVSVLTGETDEEIVISPSLRQLVLEEALSYEDAQALSQLGLRGKEPQTVEDWRKLYRALREILELEE
jgi:transcriptional regulator with XRE-family HTH domain